MDPLGVQFEEVDVDKALKEEKKRKKKEKKRLKKEKKQKRKESTIENTPESSSGSEEDLDKAVAAEYDEPPEASKAARDDWMTSTEGRNILTGEFAPKDGTENDAAKDDKPKVSAKELNPYLVNGGDGRPPADAPRQPGKSIGDGGASWRLKALKRAQALAEEEGRDVNEVVSERFGSLAKLTEGLTEQRAAHSKAHLHAQRDRVRQRDGGEAAGYLQDVGSSASQMRRPDPAKSLSWRKERKARPTPDHDQGHGDKRPSGTDGRKEDSRGENSRRDDRRMDDGRRNGGTREDSRKDDNGRDDGRGASRRTDHRDSRDTPGEDRRPARDPLGRSQDAAAIRGAAAALNNFSSDGSFMDSFQQQGPGHSGDARAATPAQPRAGSAGDAAGPSEGGEPAALHPRQAAASEQDPPSLTDGDNKSAAAALRARLMGKSAAGSSGNRGPEAKRKQVEVLPAVDAEGRAVPGAFGRDAVGKGLPDSNKRPRRLQRYEAGEKQRYFADDDAKDLQGLVKEQRYGGARDIDANLADNIARKARFRERDLDADEEYDVDGGLDMYESRNAKVSKDRLAQRQRAAQISDLHRSNKALDACNLCFSSGRRSKHLTVALGQTAYLALPDRGRLDPLHCCIIPMEHAPSSRKVDEHIWTEMRNFKKCIIQMFMAQGLNAIFLETAMRLADLRSHAIVHCIPVDQAAFQRAPIVFKKALDEAESEWSQHHAKAVIDTKVKGLRGSIPPNFPYFFVEFGLSAGYVHVIDDEEKFDRDFGRSIMAGLLKLPAEAQKRAARAEPVPVQKTLTANFAQRFDAYDWTKQLA